MLITKCYFTSAEFGALRFVVVDLLVFSLNDLSQLTLSDLVLSAIEDKRKHEVVLDLAIA